MEFGAPTGTFASLLLLASAEAAFAVIFAFLLITTAAQALLQRVMGLSVLIAITYGMERSIVQACLESERPHWAATTASLLWVQLLSASDLLLASRVDRTQLPRQSTTNSAICLLWNMRRVGTRWQVKNVPSVANQQGQTRAGFIFRRLASLLVAYLFVDVVASLPPPDPTLVQAEKATLFSLRTLGVDDIIFRSAMTISYWITTATLNLVMANVGAIAAVLLGLSTPLDCPPLYGSFAEAYTIRRFWGISWHQMFRGFLTGHADLIVGNVPHLPRASLLSRYARLAAAFFISGVIHHRANQLMGVPDSENGAVAFFLLHALCIMLEDATTPIASKVLPATLCRALGWAWVLGFFIWSSPIWAYSSSRLGIEAAALLPVRLVGPWIIQALTK